MQRAASSDSYLFETNGIGIPVTQLVTATNKEGHWDTGHRVWEGFVLLKQKDQSVRALSAGIPKHLRVP